MGGGASSLNLSSHTYLYHVSLFSSSPDHSVRRQSIVTMSRRCARFDPTKYTWSEGGEDHETRQDLFSLMTRPPTPVNAANNPSNTPGMAELVAASLQEGLVIFCDHVEEGPLCFICAMPAATSLVADPSLGQGEHELTMCFECAVMSGKNFLKRPCTNLCGLECHKNYRCCQVCVEKKSCIACGEGESGGTSYLGSSWCLECIQRNVPGENKTCRYDGCDTVGCYRTENYCKMHMRLGARERSGLDGCKRCGKNKFSGEKPQPGISYCPTCRTKCKFQDSNGGYICDADISGYPGGNGAGSSGYCSTHRSKGPKGCKRCGGGKQGRRTSYCSDCKPKCKNKVKRCDADITHIQKGQGKAKSGLCEECYDNGKKKSSK